MAIHRPGLKLWVKLAANEPGMIFKLDDLHQASIWRKPAQNHPLAAKEFAVAIVEFIAMAMALGNSVT